MFKKVLVDFTVKRQTQLSIMSSFHVFLLNISFTLNSVGPIIRDAIPSLSFASLFYFTLSRRIAYMLTIVSAPYVVVRKREALNTKQKI